MTLSKQIKHILLDLFSDGKEHTVPEIKNHLIANNIHLDKSSTLLRNIMYTLKKETPNLINPIRGTYQLLLAKSNSYDNRTNLDIAIKEIENAVYDCKNFSWYSCSDTDLELARSKVKKLLTLSNTISTMLK